MAALLVHVSKALRDKPREAQYKEELEKMLAAKEEKERAAAAEADH